MKKDSYLHRILAPAIVLLAIFFTSCIIDPIEPIPQPQPIDYTPEVNDPVTNDFTMVKACIGLTRASAETILNDNGFISNGERYVKTENNVTKILSLWSPSQGCVKQGELYVKDEGLSVMLPVFKQWMLEFRASTAFTKLVRSHYSLKVDENNQVFNTPEELLSALETIDSSSNVNISFTGNDIYANEYEIFLTTGYTNWVELRIYNSLAGSPSGDGTQGNLQNEDLHKNILISKVDYLTFRPKGFYALNVQNPDPSGNEIPFLSQYQSPGDFGSIKLFYQNTNNLLLSGSIIWSGCGHLDFPDHFKNGLTLNNGLPYPGQNKVSFINNSGNYITTSEETDLQHIWQTVSKQKEFQHYYGNTHKKVAVYLYTPSVGIGNPADWYYLVFVEQ